MSSMADEAPIADSLCPSWAGALGYGGVAAAVVLSNWGSAWGTWKAGTSLVHTGIRHPKSVMKNVIPIVMAGVIGIYGLIVGVILGQGIPTPNGDRHNKYSIYAGMAHLSAGLCCGVSGLVAGGCIGIVGDYGVRSVGYRASAVTVVFVAGSGQPESQGYSTIPDNDDGGAGAGGGGGTSMEDVSGSDDQNKLFVAMLIMLIFSEALALYGLIVALIVSQHDYTCG